MKKLIAFHSIFLLLLSCNNDHGFKYKSLDYFKNDMYSLKSGTRIKLLSFSSGPACTDKETYYYQFIGINEETNDTVRILAPCQTITDKNPPAEGSFEPWTETSHIIDSVSQQLNLDKIELENARKRVVFNKYLRDLEEGHYKTAIGTLGF